MPLKLNTASNGSVTIDAANTASNFTLTVPAQTATVLTNKTAGTVLQVIQSTTTTETSTSSTSFVDTTLSASITPSSSASKILVFVSGGLYCGNTGYNSYANARLLRGATALIDTTHMTDNQTGSGVGPTAAASLNISYVDSPSSTSSLTYKLQIRSQFSSYSPVIKFPFQSGSTATATIILMEIAG